VCTNIEAFNVKKDYERGDAVGVRKYSSSFVVNKGQLNGSSGLYLNNGFLTT
jgi:hypothetical protein